MWPYVFLTVLLGGSAFAQAPSTAPIACDEEAACLAKLKGMASREGDVLTLKLANGTTKTFKDNRKACEEDDGASCVSYQLRGYRPAQNVYVIGLTLYEGLGAELVSMRTGEVLSLPNMPEFSPSGRLLAAVDNDQTDTPEYKIGIWSLDGEGRAKQELRYIPPSLDEVWEIVRWEGDAKVVFKVNSFDDAPLTAANRGETLLNEQVWAVNRPQKRRK